MAVRKIAISVPEDVLRQVDRLAKKSKTTRSGLITQLLQEVSHASNRSDIMAQINRLFEDASLNREQSDTANAFSRATRKDDETW